MSHPGSHRYRYAGLALALLLGAVALGCTPADPMSTFDTAGPVARSQLVLFYWIFGAAVLVFILVGGVLLYEMLRFRRKPGDAVPEQTHGHKPLEIGWTILPAVILAVVAVPTVTTVFYNANPPDDPDAITIDAIAHQWWWEFRYPHPTEAGEQLVTANEVHIPVDVVINFNLDSKDVLHSFWIPKLAGKVDMVPNGKNTLWLKADVPGEYYGQCAEFCGEAHAKMRFKVVAEPRTVFNTWLVAQGEPEAVPADGSLALEGQSLFEGRQAECWACHTVKGSSRSRGQVGPPLTHLTDRGHIVDGLMENTPENLRIWLEDPCAVKPGNKMCTGAPVFNDPERKLSDDQISALVAYLSSLR